MPLRRRGYLCDMKILLLSLLLGTALPASEPDSLKAYMVATAHFDTQWNWDVKESIDVYLRPTMTQNFWLFEHFPHYIFNFESAQKYAWMKEYYPEEYETLKDYIRQGRWHVSGGAWDASDVNIPSSESLFRNFLQGQSFFREEFGVTSNDVFIPDSFGFGYALPSVAAHCGMIGFSTQKLIWRKDRSFYPDGEKTPFTIGLWQGVDGSRIMAVADGGGYGTTYYYDDVTENSRIIDRAKKGPNRTAFAYYGVGDRGGSPTLPSVWSVEQALRGGKGPVKVLSAKSDQIFEDYLPYESHPELEVFDGELLMDVHGVGCYTSQAVMKKFNRKVEVLADAAESSSVIAEVLGGMRYPSADLTKAWRRMLWHHHHDDITGTSIPASYTFSWNDEILAESVFAEVLTHASGTVSRLMDTRAKGQAIVVYNPLSTARTDLVEAWVPFAKRPAGIRVHSPKGAVPAQLLDYQDGMAHLLFAATVGPFSYTVFDVTAGKETASRLKVGDRTLENSVYRVTLNAQGDLASVVDKRSGRELVKPGEAFRLKAFTEDVSTEYPAWEIYRRILDGATEEIDGDVRITRGLEGPLKASLRVERTWNGSSFVQEISLTDGAADDILVIDNTIDWESRKTLLKAEFPMTVAAPEAAYDLGIGHIRRGNNNDHAFEVVGQQWADVTAPDGSYGIAILNDCKYGWDKPSDDVLRLTLLHTPDPGRAFPYQEHQDHGHHTFRYAVVGHDGALADSRVSWKAKAFNEPLIPFLVPSHKGELGKAWSFARSSTPQLEVKALKKAEDGSGYILRFNEVEGRSFDNAWIEFDLPIASAWEANGLEDNITPARFEGKRLYVSGTRFQPRTFKLTFAAAARQGIPESKRVDLPLNAVAVTTDAFNQTGNFDGRGNSFAAELLPDEIVSNGIPFRIQSDPTAFNYVRCQADTIVLPEHAGMSRLYLLVTSSRGDRKASFSVDGKPFTFDIPEWTGFIGQWSWKGENEGYMKSMAPAYTADHRHNGRKGNDSYTFAYLFKVRMDIPDNARELVLPADAGIAVFAATLSADPALDVVPAAEIRFLPETTRPVEYTADPARVRPDRSAW